MRSLKIADVERYSDLEKNTLEIEYGLTYEIDTCSFAVKGDMPAEGEEVIIEDGSRLFAGIIVKVELARTFPSKTIKVWNVDCDDYTALLDRRLVVETYENKTADWIFQDITAKYCPGFTVAGVQAGAPAVEYIVFEYVRPSECFKQLCDYVGWHWQPDYYKDLHFFSAEELASPAPMTLVPGGKFRFGKHSIDTQGLRNRVYIRGGTMLSDPQTIQWKADGVARIWTLPWGPHEVSFKVGEVLMTVGVENLHDEEDFDYMMSFSEKYIRCSAQTATPVEGITMALTARQDIPVITMVEDYASQAAIAKAQGGDGVYEHVIVDDSLTTIQAAEVAGMADLREHANPRVKGSFETEYIVKDVILDWELGIEQATQTGSYFLMQDASAGQRFKATAELAGAEHVRVSVLGSEKFVIPPEFIGFHIYTDDNGVPGNTISSTGFATVAGADWPNNPMEPEWVTAEISLDEPLEEGKYYWLVLITEPGYENAYVKFCVFSSATIDPNQDYDIIHTLTFSDASGNCPIRLYRGSLAAISGTVYYRAGTSGDWTSLSVSGTSTTFPITSTTMQVAHGWNKSGNNYMTPSFWGATNITSIAISQKSFLTGTMGTSFMYCYAIGCSSLTSLDVPDTSGLESVGNYFMYAYAGGCSNLTSLDVPDTSGLESVGGYFMRSYAYGCSSLTELVLPAVGWFKDNNVDWSVPADRLGVLKGRVLHSDDLNGWRALTAEGKTLYTNYIRDPELVYYDGTVDPYSYGYYASRSGSSQWSIQANRDMAFKIEVPVAHIWQPGQIMEINLPDRGVEGEYLIQRVTITPTWSNPSIWTFRVEYGGRLFGIADFLKALVSAQQKKRNIEPTKSIQKYVYGEETLQISDELLTATRTLPFVCGDADAVCGMVVVSNGL